MSSGQLPPRTRPVSVAPGRLTVEDHLETILRGVGPLAAYDQPVVESLGLTLHEDVVSDHDLPRFSTAGVDGYAVNATDIVGARSGEPVELPVVAEIVPGLGKPFAISGGSCVRIMTGAPLPRGADAVVPADATDGGRTTVAINRAVLAGSGVRHAAGDLSRGGVALPEGAVLGPREIGLLAAIGRDRVRARPRPRVVVMSTGRELREPGAHLDVDSVSDANSSMLAAAVRDLGAIAYRVGVVDDDPAHFKRVLSDQLVRADLVITTGGITGDERALVKRTLTEVGEVTFSDVAIHPGRTHGFGRVFDEQTPVITLPGDPVSAYVGFEVFVVPAIRRMLGRTPYRRPQVHAVLAEDLTSETGLREYRPAYFEVTHRGAKVTPLPRTGPHLVGALAKANALIVVGEDESALNLGDTVRTLVLDRNF